MRMALVLFPALLLAACGQEPETIQSCVARFSHMSAGLPAFSGDVAATYTFDLSPLGRQRIGELMQAGLDGRGPPSVVATIVASSASIRGFERSPSGPHGSLFTSSGVTMLRTPRSIEDSPANAVRQGCAMLPGGRLRSIALTPA